MQALRFQCSPYHVNSAFWPVIDNFERALKFARNGTSDAKLNKLEALIVSQFGRPLADVRFIASILSIPFKVRYGALPMTPQKHKDETLRTLADLIEAAARLQPSVLLVEDAHWADPTTLEVLDRLIDRVRSVPLKTAILPSRPARANAVARSGGPGCPQGIAAGDAQRPGRLRARRHSHRRDGRRDHPIAAGLHGRIKTRRLDADPRRR